MKVAWTGDVVQETSAEGDPQSNGAAASTVNVVKGHVRIDQTGSGVGFECESASRPRLVDVACAVCTSKHRRFAVGRDGKHTDETWEGAVSPWHSLVSECGGCRCSHPAAVWGPLDSRFEQGRYLGPMDGSNTVFIGTASAVVNGRTIKRLPPGERWTGILLDEELGSELTPNALEDDGGRVGIRAPVLQPHAAVPLPLLAPEVRQVRRALLRWTDFEQFGYTDNCPGCANARAGREQVVDHSEHCRSLA